MTLTLNLIVGLRTLQGTKGWHLCSLAVIVLFDDHNLCSNARNRQLETLELPSLALTVPLAAAIIIRYFGKESGVQSRCQSP